MNRPKIMRAERNYFRVRYITKDGRKGYVVPDFYESKEAAIKETMEDLEIERITSIRREKPRDYEVERYLREKRYLRERRHQQ